MFEKYLLNRLKQSRPCYFLRKEIPWLTCLFLLVCLFFCLTLTLNLFYHNIPICSCSDDMEENSRSARRAFDSEAPHDKWRRFAEREDFFIRVSVFSRNYSQWLENSFPTSRTTSNGWTNTTSPWLFVEYTLIWGLLSLSLNNFI